MLFGDDGFSKELEDPFKLTPKEPLIFGIELDACSKQMNKLMCLGITNHYDESYLEYLQQVERQTEQTRAKPVHEKVPSSKQSRSESTHVSRSAGLKPKTHHLDTAKPSTPSKLGLLGAKRGASSPNLPCSSRQVEEAGFSVPLKIHRNGLLFQDTLIYSFV